VGYVTSCVTRGPVSSPPLRTQVLPDRWSDG
jgi:hypothetical protein